MICTPNVYFQTLLKLYYNHVGTDKGRCIQSKIKTVTYILNVGQPHTVNPHEVHDETARFKNI